MAVSDSVSMQVTSTSSLQYSAEIIAAPGSGNALVIDAIQIGPDHTNLSPAARFDCRIMSKSGSVYTDETGWFRVNASGVGTATHALGQGIQCATNKPLHAQFQSSSAGKYRVGLLVRSVAV